MAPIETEYYDLLAVPHDVESTELKKAYRKAAVKFHPDKERDPAKKEEAEERFKEISKAYQVLSVPEQREKYDKYGRSMVDKEGPGMEDAADFFANVFGGDRFEEYIGEISLMKEMTNVASAVMTDEEKAEMEKEMKEAHRGDASPSPASPSPLEHSQPQPETHHAPALDDTNKTVHVPADPLLSPRPSVPSAQPANTPSLSLAASPAISPSPSPSPGTIDSSRPSSKKGKQKLTPEQKAKLEELEKKRRESMEARVNLLVKKLVDRVRPFVEAERPGTQGDPETEAFQKKIMTEAEDLKLESFGIELLQTIGTVYATKASSYFKSKKFLGLPGFWSRMKEKGAMAKDVWGVIGSAMGVQNIMHEMERLQAKGDAADEELKALEMDMTGKILLASWRGTRFEVMQVLREVCDKFLKDPTVPDSVIANRAKALLIMGHIFRSVKPDESAEDRRELERMVAEAATGKSKHDQLRAEARAASRAKRDAERNATPSPSHDGYKEKERTGPSSSSLHGHSKSTA